MAFTQTVLPDLHEAVSAWFLGPQGENKELLKELFGNAVESQCDLRRNFHNEDGEFITAEIKSSAVFQRNTAKLQKHYTDLLNTLNTYSVPFFSPRYAGHMSFETSMPAILGYISTVLFNPNNVAFEASPVTTLLELEVGQQLCQMLGYTKEEKEPWGHIASDGTLANMESMWAARNLKFYPLSLKKAMEGGNALEFIADSFEITTSAEPRETKLFKDLTTWELINLRSPDILDIADRLQVQYGITSTYLTSALTPFLIQSIGKDELEREFGISSAPQYLITNTKHYSWPKSAALVGIGSENCVNVAVDHNARVNIDALREQLEDRFQNQQAVYAVVAIIGSTEEGSVDPLDEILNLRDEFQARGMSFIVHADAAWGGYFASMLREPPPNTISNRDPNDQDTEAGRDFVPTMTMRDFSVKQFEALKHADSITIDPHKAGYVPYPAGGLCYKDGRMRYLLTWTAPYLHDADNGESIGIYGIEGSKPGAQAAAVWLHHQVVGLHKEGHGGLLGETTFTCRRLAAHWSAMSNVDTDFIVVPLNRLPSETDTTALDDPELEQDKAYIRENILGKSNEDVAKNKQAMDMLCNLGSDLNINAFLANFRINGKPNEDVEEANYLNQRIFDRLSLTNVKELPTESPMFLSATTFSHSDYGVCADDLKRRSGLETDSQQDLFVLRNVSMSPFQTAGDFCQKLADTFQSVVEDEIKNAVERNTVSPENLSFVIQGTDKVYLTLRPYFHKANGRHQLILSGDLDQSSSIAYKAARQSNPKEVYTLDTCDPTTVAALTSTRAFGAKISGKGLCLSNVGVSNLTVIKSRPLDSKWRDFDYPATYTPFYLYGTSQQQLNVDHMLLHAPNAQLSSDQVSLQLDSYASKRLTTSQLNRALAQGVVARIKRPEAAFQPVSATSPPAFFAPGATLAVDIYEDPRRAVAHGPGLASIGSEHQIGTGTITLGKSTYVDVTRLNTQDFADKKRQVSDYASAKASKETKAAWSNVISASLLGAKGGISAGPGGVQITGAFSPGIKPPSLQVGSLRLGLPV